MWQACVLENTGRTGGVGARFFRMARGTLQARDSERDSECGSKRDSERDSERDLWLGA